MSAPYVDPNAGQQHYAPPPQAQPMPQPVAQPVAQPMAQPMAQAPMRAAVGGQVGLCTDGFSHNFQKEFSMCGLCWVFWCFPCGLYCCWNQADERCNKCQLVIKK